jgi:hypothetical protein
MIDMFAVNVNIRSLKERKEAHQGDGKDLQEKERNRRKWYYLSFIFLEISFFSPIFIYIQLNFI